ncbi:MAG: homoserine kinase [Chloroflexi bacterium]|nr:homoserine kinase [Chloroflexota bacterium]
MDKPRLTVRVPATTANLGPGFDCLGLALDLHNTVSVEPGPFGVRVTGQGETTLPRNRRNLVYRSMERVFDRLGSGIPDMRLTCHNEIPLTRGLGSSSAATVAGLVAGNALAGNALSQEDILTMAAELEGHPDNVTPALLGGCQVVVQTERGLVHAPVPLATDLIAVLFVPDFELRTSQARAVLPSVVPRGDAIYNVGRVALLVTALATGRGSLLREATRDRLHQPYRERLFPAMTRLFDAALEAGALGAFLSGAGPTVLALVSGDSSAVARALGEVARLAGLPGHVRIARPSTAGTQVIAGD